MYIIVLDGPMALATFVRVVGGADCIGSGGFFDTSFNKAQAM
jgi:hypothetical protein